MNRYKAYGLNIASEIPLPELPAASGNADVVIRIGAVPQPPSQGNDLSLWFETQDSDLWMRIPSVAEYFISGGREIIVDPHEPEQEKEIRTFLLGSAFGAVLHQRGNLVLHGSAIIDEGGGVLFTGRSGAGKSTLMMQFANIGYAVLSDDVCPIRRDENGILMISPGYPGAKLWEDAICRMSKETQSLLPVMFKVGKYRYNLENVYHDQPAPLRRVYILEPSSGDQVEINEVEGAYKVAALIENTFRLNFIQAMGLEPANLRRCADATKDIRVFRVSRPEKGDSVERLFSRVKQHMKGDTDQ